MSGWWLSLCVHCQKYLFMTWKILGLFVFQTKLCRTLAQSSLKTIDQDYSRTIRTVESLSYIIYAHVILKVPILHYYAQAVGHWLFTYGGQSAWGLWWMQWLCNRLFSRYFGFTLSLSLHQCSMLIHLFIHSLIHPFNYWYCTLCI